MRAAPFSQRTRLDTIVRPQPALRMLVITSTSEPRGALRVAQSTPGFPTSEVRWATLCSARDACGCEGPTA